MVLRLSTVSKHLYTKRLYSTLCQRRMDVKGGLPSLSSSLSSSSASSSSSLSSSPEEDTGGSVSRPVLLFDVMDTIVLDPFYTMMPDHFGLTFEQLLEQKHPDMWVQFESNMITEDYFFENFFLDKRPVDRQRFVDMLRGSYTYLPGMEDVLRRLKDAGHTMKTFSNYPMWYQYIEEELALSRYVDWTYVSCTGPLEGKRKPSIESYQCVLETEGHDTHIIFIDDRDSNVQAARAAGLEGVLFENAEKLEETLRHVHGLQF